MIQIIGGESHFDRLAINFVDAKEWLQLSLRTRLGGASDFRSYYSFDRLHLN